MNLKSIKITALTLAAATVLSASSQAAGTPAILQNLNKGNEVKATKLSDQELSSTTGEFIWVIPAARVVVHVGVAVNIGYATWKAKRR